MKPLSIKIAFTTDKGGLDDRIVERFGRARTFTIVEVDEKGGIDDHITATGYPYPEDKHHPLGVRKKER